jgi:alpha-glucoside transport system substrate-binding protein
MSKFGRFTLLSLLLALMLVLVACGGGTQEATPTEAAVEAPTEEAAPEEAEPVAEEEVAPAETGDMAFPMMAGGALEAAMAGEYAGTVVTVDGPFADADTVKFEQSVVAFEEATGIDVQYIGGKEFEGSIGVRVEAGDAPDIADFPQPGLLATFVRQGYVVDVSTFLDEGWLNQQYNPSWLQMATIDGADGPIMAGVFHRFNGKSLVWYPKDDFDAAGYTVPETWDELLALTQQIADDGDPAWCIGIESGAATGWPATDWTEDLMLRTTSLENYDAWVEWRRCPSTAPKCARRLKRSARYGSIPDYVFGGTNGIVSTNFGDSPAPMFEDPPGCWLHRQGNFITGFFPEGVGSGSRLRLLLSASGESMSRWVGRSWLPATSWPCSMTGRKCGR